MKKISVVILASMFGIMNASAQVGVGVTGSVEGSAKLQVDASDKGFLPPRVTLTATNVAAPVTSPATGLLVFNTASNGSGSTAVSPGFYYYSGSAWVRLIVPTDNAANVTGTVPITNGGTGQTTSTAALNALLPAQTGNAEKILKTDGTNTSWVTNVALTSAVIGTMGVGGQNSGANSYTGAFITLPPGKWSVSVSMLAYIGNSGNFWVQTGFSASSTSIGLGADGVSGGPTLISGLIVGTKYNMITGTVIINNTSGASRTYYYCTAGTESQTLTNFGRNTYAENSIVAYPMN